MLWDYLVVSPKVKLQAQLAELGKQGWELVTIQTWSTATPDMILKRPLTFPYPQTETE